MNKLFYAGVAVVGIFLGSFTLAGAVSTFIPQQGGTGTTSPSGILYGTNSGTTPLQTVVIGSNLTFSGGTLSASASGGSGTGSVSTSSLETAGQLAYWNTTSGYPAKLDKVSTTTVSCSGTASCTSFVVIGGSPITITGSASGGSGNTTWELSANGLTGFLTPTTTQKLFLGQASSTVFSAHTAFFGATATSSFSTAGALTLATPLLVASGGSGAGTLTGLLSGNGTSAFTATANGTAGFVLAMSGGVPTWVATSSIQNITLTTTGSSGAATLSGTTLNIPQYAASAGGLGTTSPWTAGQLAYVVNNSTVSSVATSSETCTSPLSCTAHDVLTGGGAITLGTVPIAKGGTNSTALGSGSPLYFNGASIVASSTTGIFDYFIGTTTATSTLLGGLKTTALQVTGFSAANCAVKAYTDGTLYCGVDATGGGSGSGNVATSTNEAANQIPVFSSNSATPATIRGYTNFLYDGTLLGIGTTSPWGQLSVNPTNANGAAPSFVVGSTSATTFIVAANGSVGIGTSSPSSLYNLSIVGTGNITNYLLVSNHKISDNALGGLLFQATIGSSDFSISPTNVTFFDNLLNNNGLNSRIGLGTLTPNFLLEIASSTGPQLSLTDLNSSSPWTMRSINGNFYLATSSPTTTATSTVSSLSINQNGQLTLPFYGAATGCAQFGAGGLLSNTGTACGTGGGGGISDPFTHVSVWGQTTSATSTLIALTGTPYSLVASSTAAFSAIQVGSSTSQAFTNNPLLIVGNVNSFTQSVVQNLSNGSVASADYVLGNDKMTNTTYYADLGYNSSGNSDSSYTGFSTNSAYLYNNDGELDFATASTTAGSVIKFFTGGTLTANERARFDVNGKFGIGTSSPYSLFSLNAPGGATPYFAIGSSTGEVYSIRQSNTAYFGLGTSTSALTAGTTTILMQKLQFQGGDSAGVTRCVFVNAAGAMVVQAGPCL